MLLPSIHLLLFVHTELARAHVHQKEESAAVQLVSTDVKTEEGGRRTRWRVFGRSRTWRSPCVGDVGAAARRLLVSMMPFPIKNQRTVQKLLTKTLKMLKITTRMIALHFALKPTTTITQATSPNTLTITLPIPQ